MTLNTAQQAVLAGMRRVSDAATARATATGAPTIAAAAGQAFADPRALEGVPAEHVALVLGHVASVLVALARIALAEGEDPSALVSPSIVDCLAMASTEALDRALLDRLAQD